jgi:hypothetical protein
MLETKTVEFETPYGPANVVYNVPHPEWDEPLSVSQVVVQCPDNIVWDDHTGMWYPEPQVVDYVLPKARAVCEMLGIPRYEWLREVRRGNVWAIEEEFRLGVRMGSLVGDER